MAGETNGYPSAPDGEMEALCHNAYRWADAMMEARKK
jgi:hypothetical protein